MNKINKVFITMFLSIILTLFVGIEAKAATEPTLYPGSSGSSVRYLQQLLNTVDNSRLATDGIYGNATRQAVRVFQSKYRLGVDGICGPITWAKLHSLENEKNQGKTTKTINYGGGTFIVPKNYDAKYVYAQSTSKNCTSTASNIAVSIARGETYRNTGWSGGCTWKDANGSSLHWIGYDKTSAQEKLNKSAMIVSNGYPVVIRLGTDSGHSVCVIGVKKGADMNRIAYSDLLIADPANGKVKLMSDVKATTWWHGGVKSYNGTETTRWCLYVPKQAPAALMDGFRIY